MRIGELSRQTGVSVRALRHYDQLGLLSPARSENRYREFQTEDVERVHLIRYFVSVGFSLDEILRCAPCFQRGGQPVRPVPVAELLELYERKIRDVDAHLAALQLLREKLHAHKTRLAHEARQTDVHPAPPPVT